MGVKLRPSTSILKPTTRRLLRQGKSTKARTDLGQSGRNAMAGRLRQWRSGRGKGPQVH